MRSRVRLARNCAGGRLFIFARSVYSGPIERELACPGSLQLGAANHLKGERQSGCMSGLESQPVEGFVSRWSFDANQDEVERVLYDRYLAPRGRAGKVSGPRLKGRVRPLVEDPIGQPAPDSADGRIKGSARTWRRAELYPVPQPTSNKRHCVRIQRGEHDLTPIACREVPVGEQVDCTGNPVVRPGAV